MSGCFAGVGSGIRVLLVRHIIGARGEVNSTPSPYPFFVRV